MTPGTALIVAAKPGKLTSAANGATGSKAGQEARAAKKSKFKPKISRLRKPDDMTLEAWQVALRREFGRKQNFRLKNVGDQPMFSEFEVTNPQTKRTYRVAVRGSRPGDNFCSCPDFAVNTLGTCKHVEFVLGKLGRSRAARKKLDAGSQPPYSEVHVRYGAKREVVFHVGSECPTALARGAMQLFGSDGRLREEAYGSFPEFLKQAASFKHDLRCYDDALALIAQVRDRASLAEKIEEAFPRGIRSAAFNKLLSVPLYPYQREGALFLAKAGRCLLADDMGLGKTIQAIAATEILHRTMGIQRVLIVCPTSLKHQWRREIEKFAGRQAVVVEGLQGERTKRYAAESMYKIANYDIVYRDLELIRRWQPDLVILDEAQRIKNWKTRTAQSVKQIPSDYAFVLTGTPLENRLEELHSIVEFVDRFRLGPMFRFLSEHQHVDQTGRVVGYRNLSHISETLSPILLRRTKDKVLKELPERLDKRMFVPMTPQQQEHHDENKELVGRIVQKWRRLGFLPEADQRRLMIFLQNMRMACNSTYLLDKKTDYGVKADELMTVLEEAFEEDAVKVVIFSQWTRMHELVAARLKPRKWGHVLFSGDVPGPKRKDLIHRFKEDPDCRLFLSTDAGGVGLNLQHASVVVNLDQPWNPAVLEQRVGRVHRLGQQRPVRVVHFISQGTIEEGMLALLGFKKSVFTGVLDGGPSEVFLGGTRLTRFMESVEKVTTSISEPMPTEPQSADVQEEAPSEDDAPRKRIGIQDPRAIGPPQVAVENPWNDVFSAGMSLLEKLKGAMSLPQGPSQSQSRASGGLVLPGELITRDEASGQPYLKLPLPQPEVMEKIAGLLTALVGRL